MSVRTQQLRQQSGAAATNGSRTVFFNADLLLASATSKADKSSDILILLL